jgi:transposase
VSEWSQIIRGSLQGAPFLVPHMSRPEIALHKNSKAMEERMKSLYIKRTQQDYPLSFKLAVVREVENGTIGVNAAMRQYGIQGHTTIAQWRRKYGILDKDFQDQKSMPKTPQQKIFELEQKVRLLEKEKAFLELEMINAVDKANILDKLVQLAEQEYSIRIRKNSFSGQSEVTQKSSKKR